MCDYFKYLTILHSSFECFCLALWFFFFFWGRFLLFIYWQSGSLFKQQVALHIRGLQITATGVVKSLGRRISFCLRRRGTISRHNTALRSWRVTWPLTVQLDKDEAEFGPLGGRWNRRHSSSSALEALQVAPVNPILEGGSEKSSRWRIPEE